jgi:hypothetical protein
MKWTAFGRIYKWRPALYVKARCAGKDRSGKDFFCKNYTRGDSRVGPSRRALEGRREKAIRAVHMRPQAQPLARVERDFLRCKQLGA